MNCENVQKILDGYVNGSLSAEQTKLVDEHLLVCKECLEESIALKELFLTIKLIPKAYPSKTFKKKILAKYKTEIKKEKSMFGVVLFSFPPIFMTIFYFLFMIFLHLMNFPDDVESMIYQF